MGNQGHSWDDGRKAVEWVQSGAIGDVTEVHVWTNRPLSYWPQGIPRPEPRRISEDLRWNMSGVMARLANAMGIYSVPDELSWDLFLGPAPAVRISPGVSPVQLARLGGLGLRRARRHGRAPDRSRRTGRSISAIRRRSKPSRRRWRRPASRWPPTTYYEFPARGSKPPVKLTWYDGGMFPPTPPEFGEGEKLNAEGGAIMVGTKGKVIYDTYGLKSRLLPDSLQKSVGDPPKTLPRITTSHETNWSNACKGTGQASTPFEYTAKLTEVMLLGVVALRAGDEDSLRRRRTCASPTRARRNDLLKREYRRGWSL